MIKFSEKSDAIKKVGINRYQLSAPHYWVLEPYGSYRFDFHVDVHLVEYCSAITVADPIVNLFISTSGYNSAEVRPLLLNVFNPTRNRMYIKKGQPLGELIALREA